MGFRKPHPINCLLQNNCCSKSIDGDANESAKQWHNGCRRNDAQNAYRIQITGTNISNVRRRQCISWSNFCRSIRLCTFALLLLNADVIAAEPQQNQHQQSTPCEARVLDELPPDPVNIEIHDCVCYSRTRREFHTFLFCFNIFQLEFDSFRRFLHHSRLGNSAARVQFICFKRQKYLSDGIYSNETCTCW